MDGLALLATMVLSFAATFAVTPWFIRKLREKGFVGNDLNKRGMPKIANFAGISVIFGLTIGLLFGIGFLTFSGENPVPLLAALASVLMIAFVGLIDDVLNVRQIVRVAMPVLAALPLIAVQAGDTSMTLPVIGLVNFGVWYYVLVAIGVTGAANATNMLAGYNGMEVSLASISYAAMLFLALTTGQYQAAILLVAAIGACAAFLKWNFFPARTFPGNVLNYALGAVLACAAIIGNMERLGMIIIALYYVEFILKARGLFRPKWWGLPDRKGILAPVSRRIYSVPNLLMKLNPVTERKLVLEMCLLQIIVAVTALWISLAA
jgi:UDP-N-acetylglucosamine--dolichyl-phosphate N-acetylglucosaminephosphotransferase